jgi:transcriptional regulator with XRE-family HTH domain
MSSRNDERFMIAQRLRMARDLAGLSQSQVAQMMGLQRPSVSEIEAGRRKVSAEELARLAEIYDADIGWLTGVESSGDDARVELAARELSKLNPDDLDRLMELLKSLRLAEE